MSTVEWFIAMYGLLAELRDDKITNHEFILRCDDLLDELEDNVEVAA